MYSSKDDEEYKKRYERAKSISNSLSNNINVNNVILNNITTGQNEQEQVYINRIQRARELSNSINPRQNVSAPTISEEDKIKSQQNAQKFLDLMDKNVEAESENQYTNKNTVEDNQAQSLQTRKNQTKKKEEIDQQIKNAEIKTVNSPTKNTSIRNNDIKIGLANSEEIQNTQELSTSDIKAMEEANQKNKNIQKGGIDAFNEWADTTLNNILGGAKQAAAGLANVVTTITSFGIRGLEGASRIVGLNDMVDSLNQGYNNVVDVGSNINEKANYEKTVTSQVKNDFIKTSGDVSNVISNMIGNTLIGYATGVSGTVVQGLSVGGSSAQEVLDENKDNIEQATVTGIAKGYVSYLTERMFDANILTRGTKKTSIQEGINRIISNKINSELGKEIANKTVGIIGENLEELAEDNAGYLIDKLINNKDLPGFEQWWNNTTETAKTTTLSTMIMGLLGLGGENFSDIEMDMETEYWVEQAQRIIEQEDLAIHFNPSEVKNLNQTEQFYVTRFTQDGELANIVPTKGKTIYNPKQELNVIPVLIRDSETNYYNVIDGNTGVMLDNTYYATSMEAEGSFNEKVNKLTDLQIKNINNKINEANYLITDEIINTITQAREQLMQDKISENINKNTYTDQQFNDITKLMSQISDKSVYNNTSAKNIFKTVSNNINNISVVSEDGTNYIKSYDNSGNETYQQKLNNKIYTGAKIKEIVNNAIQNANTTDINIFQDVNTNIAQTSSQENTANLQSKETSYASQDVQKIVEPFSSQEEYTKNEMAEIWNEKINANDLDVLYDSDGNIHNYIAIEEDGDRLVVNQHDNNDNVIKSEVIPSKNGKYTAVAIKNTIEKVTNIYDENRPIKGQSDVEDNGVRNLKKNKTPYPKQKQFNKIISNAINDKTAKGSMSIAKVTPKVADRIEKITGINTLNRQEKISASDIRHILNQHGNKNVETTKGQLAVTKSDIKKIPDVIENFDKIVKGSIHKDRNGEHQTVRFIKKYDNNALYVVEVVPNKGKTLTIKTMWKKPIGLNHGNNTLHHTSKTKTNVRKIHIY